MLIHLVGEIEVAATVEAVPAIRPANLAHHVSHLVVIEDLISDRDDLAVTPDFWRLPFSQVKVRRAGIDENFEELIDVGHRWEVES